MTTPLRPGTVGKPLTAKQQQVWDLKEQGKTRPEIAALMGVSENVVSKQITYIRRKKGLTVDNRGTDLLAPANNVPAKNPEMVANAVDQVNQKMLDVGLPERLRTSLVRRLKVKHEGLETQLKAIADGEMKENLRKQIFLIDSYIDDKTASEASLRDLAVAKSQLIEKLQLLEGKPTQIISDLERKHLHELVPLLMAEAQRRGITMDGQVLEKTVGPA